MKKKLEIGVIGCSSIGRRVILPAINESEKCSLKRVGSRSIDKAKKTALEFNCKEFGSYEEVIEDKNVDIVYISLPIALQEFWIINAIKAGKHVLCEKSISISLSSIKKIWNECKRNNVKILEGFSYRYHPQHMFVKKNLKKKNLGDLHSFFSSFILPINPSKDNFRFNKKLGGGVLNDVGCYIINASRYFFEDEPISINCELFKNKEYNVDVRGSIFLEFKNKNIGFGLIGYENMFSSDYRIFCDGGTIIANKAYNVKKYESTHVRIVTDKDKIKKIFPKDQSRLMIEEFCKDVNFDRHILTEEIINQGKVMESARISSTKNKTVFLRDLK